MSEERTVGGRGGASPGPGVLGRVIQISSEGARSGSVQARAPFFPPWRFMDVCPLVVPGVATGPEVSFGKGVNGTSGPVWPVHLSSQPPELLTTIDATVMALMQGLAKGGGKGGGSADEQPPAMHAEECRDAPEGRGGRSGAVPATGRKARRYGHVSPEDVTLKGEKIHFKAGVNALSASNRISLFVRLIGGEPTCAALVNTFADLAAVTSRTCTRTELTLIGGSYHCRGANACPPCTRAKIEKRIKETLRTRRKR